MTSDASKLYNSGVAPRAGFIGHVKANSHGFELAKLSFLAIQINLIIQYIKKNVKHIKSKGKEIMKYRFSLSRKNNKLILLISDCSNALDIITKRDEQLIVSQIVEDFTTKDYFFKIICDKFDDAEKTLLKEALQLSCFFSEKNQDNAIQQINAFSSPQRYGRVGNDYTDMIGNTPLIKLNSLAADCGATVLVKLESMEPNSVKDRAVYSIISEAINRGEISDISEIIEASSGNVAFALSSILKIKMNKKPKIFISKMHGKTKIKAVRITGCPVILTDSKGGTLTAKKASLAYAKKNKNVFQLNQHGNPDNSRAHRYGTGPELYHQSHILTDQAPIEFVTGLGSGGTAVGVALFREDIKANFKVIGVEPTEASLLTGGNFNPHRFSGLASGFITNIIKENRRKIDHIETVTWQEGFEVCRRMLIEEGFFVGASSGASIAAALRRAKLPENKGKTIVTIAHDRGDRYMETEDLFLPPPEATEEDYSNR